ncbi:MAG TPA: hypothetical protein DCM68_06170 [Verrucomicrobia bacterium]|nr:hypothetical protein [Verrucomicrobiota bacterium]
MNPFSDHLDRSPWTAFAIRHLRRLAISIGLLLAALAVLELAAWHFLPKRSARYLLAGQSNGQPAWLDNPFFPYRFFPERTAPAPLPVVALQTPPPGTLRICLLGGSEALGAPEPSYGLGRQLELMLQRRYPGQPVEVVQMGLAGGNSHILREAARDLKRLAPDAVILLTGNDEVSGPYGPAAGLGRFHQSSHIARWMALFSRTHLSRLCIAALHRLQPAREDLQAWRSHEPLAMKGRMAARDPRLKTVARSFRKNLRAILAEASGASPVVIVCTVPVNLRDCAPFSSTYLEDETAAQEVRERLRTAIAAEAATNRIEAARGYADAIRRDPTHAEALFRAARMALADHHTAEAAALFTRARDADALRLRADSRINAILREGAAEAAASLLDAEALFAIRSPQGIPGRELFLDHIHFTFEANHLLASALVDRMEFLQAFDSPPAGDLPSAEELAASLLYHPWGRATQLETVLRQMLRPPFRWQFDHAETMARLMEEKRLWDARVAAITPENARAIFARRQASRPGDAWLAARTAWVLLGAGDPARAETAALAAHRQWPHRFDIRALLALIRAIQGQEAGDGIAFLRGGEADTGSYDIALAIGIGRSLLEKNLPARARAWFAYALRRDAWNSDAAISLAEAQRQLEKIDESFRTFQRAIESRTDGAFAWTAMALGQARLRLGENERAADILQQAIKRNPGNPLLWEDLATLYTLQGDWDIALECYRQSEEIAPYRYERLLKWADAHLQRALLRPAAQKLNELQRALVRIRSYLDSVPGDPDGLALQATIEGEIKKRWPEKLQADPGPDDAAPGRKFPWE